MMKRNHLSFKKWGVPECLLVKRKHFCRTRKKWVQQQFKVRFRAGFKFINCQRVDATYANVPVTRLTEMKTSEKPKIVPINPILNSVNYIRKEISCAILKVIQRNTKRYYLKQVFGTFIPSGQANFLFKYYRIYIEMICLFSPDS